MMRPVRTTIPDKGRSQDEVLEQLETFRADDIDWRGGKVFSLVYHAGEEHERFLSRAHALYSSANGLNPMAFPSLRKMEADVVDMAADLFHAPPTAVGAMSSGGTESILLAMYTYREKARRERRMLRDPEVVVPVTAHPAFDKAAHYFDIKLRKVPVTAEFLANPKKMARAINRRTIAMVGSAPQYPHGVIDPIGELGEVASRAGVPLHVDACVGGFILPWIERLGRPLPEWDFRVPGVTSISADLHKYGYAGKGASVLVWSSMSSCATSSRSSRTGRAGSMPRRWWSGRGRAGRSRRRGPRCRASARTVISRWRVAPSRRPIVSGRASGRSRVFA